MAIWIFCGTTQVTAAAKLVPSTSGPGMWHISHAITCHTTVFSPIHGIPMEQKAAIFITPVVFLQLFCWTLLPLLSYKTLSDRALHFLVLN